MVEESEDEPPGGRMLLVVLLLCGFQTAIAQEDVISGDTYIILIFEKKVFKIPFVYLQQ